MKHRYKTARCILFRDDHYLLAVHNRYWREAEHRWGLPGGQIEWGESPVTAATRELEEELQIYLPNLVEVGAYPYKRAMHMVFAAPLEQDIESYDDTELLDIRWFTEAEVAGLKARSALHADYELDAIRRLRVQLTGGGPAVAAG
jgi:8-oxo-dGTP pyrophosphatase MutT (NUDIX family)